MEFPDKHEFSSTSSAPSKIVFNCPLLPIVETWKKKKKCCKAHKDGDRCKKCPGRK